MSEIGDRAPLWGKIDKLRDEIEKLEAEAAHHKLFHMKLMAWLKEKHPTVFSEALATLLSDDSRNPRKVNIVNDMEIVEKVFLNIGAPPSAEAYCKAAILETVRLTRIDCAQALAQNKEVPLKDPEPGRTG